MKNHERLRQLGIALLSIAVLASSTPVIAAETDTAEVSVDSSTNADTGEESSDDPEADVPDNTAEDNTTSDDEVQTDAEDEDSSDEEIYEDLDEVPEGDGTISDEEEDEATDSENSGTCGDSLTWTFEDGVLTISGSGDMYGYADAAPWAGLAINSVIFGDGVTSIGSYAFKDCIGIESFELAGSIDNIGAYAFYGCTGLQCIYIPDYIKSIGEGAFYNCTSLNNVAIPVTMESIGDYAFANCTSLSIITITENIYYIGSGAFYNCTSLIDVYIDSTDISMDNAFQPVDGQVITLHGYDNVKEFVEATGNASIVYEAYPSYCGDHITWTLEDGVLTLSGWGQMYDFYNGAPWYDQREEITSIYIVSSYNWTSDFTYIGAYAFVGCTNLKSITFPAHCSFTIGYGAFWGCTGLTSLTLPDTLTGIDSYAFAACTGLNYIYIPNNTTSIGDGAFYSCTNLTSARISENVTSIGAFTFAYCSAMESITIPESVTYINEDAFYKCTALKDVYIRSNDISMDNVFKPVSGQTITLYGNENVKEYVEALGNENVLYEALPGSCGDFLTWTFEDGTLTISGYGAMFDYYENNYNLAPWRDYDITSVILPDGITTIGTYAFTGCTGITSITFPESMRTIKYAAFKNCTGLTNITILNGLDYIDDYAFYHCTSLTDVTFPESITWIGYAAFAQCNSFTNITIPDTVTDLAPYAFAECTSLVNINLPSTLTEIPSSLCQGDTALTSIEIPYGVTQIWQDAFCNCTSLTTVTIPNTVEYISSAFENCTSLTTLVFPESIVIPGRLTGCTSLTDIYFYTESTYLNLTLYPEGDQVLTLHGKQNVKDYVDSLGNENILYAELIEITEQPASTTVFENQDFQFAVAAKGNVLSYQWQYSKDNGTTWVDTNCTSETYTDRVSSNQNGYLYRCVITDAYGYSVTTDTATLTVNSNRGHGFDDHGFDDHGFDDHGFGYDHGFGPHSFNPWNSYYYWMPRM